MKKTLLFICVSLVLLSSCSKSDETKCNDLKEEFDNCKKLETQEKRISCVKPVLAKIHQMALEVRERDQAKASKFYCNINLVFPAE